MVCPWNASRRLLVCRQGKQGLFAITADSTARQLTQLRLPAAAVLLHYSLCCMQMIDTTDKATSPHAHISTEDQATSPHAGGTRATPNRQPPGQAGPPRFQGTPSNNGMMPASPKKHNLNANALNSLPKNAKVDGVEPSSLLIVVPKNFFPKVKPTCCQMCMLPACGYGLQGEAC